MPDNIALRDANNVIANGATDELADGSQSPKVTLLPGDGTTTGISPATSNNQLATNALLGATNETAPGTDVGTSGLNGRMQRIAQRLTSLIALLPASLGQKTQANSFGVTLATDDVLLGRVGEVQSNPTANTVLARLRDINTSLSSSSFAAGTAGAASTDVLTVQGASGMIPLVVDGGRVRRIQIVPTIDSTAVIAGDVLAATEIVAAVTRQNDAQAICQAVSFHDAADQKKGLTAVFFRTNVSIGSENAAAGVAAADVDEILGWVTVLAADYKDFGSGSVARKTAGFIIQPASGTDDIYMAIIADEAADYTATTDLTITLEVLQD